MYTVKKFTRFLDFFDQTSLELGKLFLARKSLVSDIPAGDGNVPNFFLQCSKSGRFRLSPFPISRI